MLRKAATPGAKVEKTVDGWHLEIPPGRGGSYRLSQLDNYSNLNRMDFPVNPPASLSLYARASSPNPAGTWGFGFWNDPFAFSAGLQGKPRRLPVLPNSCWFFYASPQNHLSFHDGLPGNGLMAQTFRSPKLPPAIFLPGILAAPFLFIKPASRHLRNIAGKIIREDSRLMDIDPTGWHSYELNWNLEHVSFFVDEKIMFETAISPAGPLGVVIWIDNQFAAWTSGGEVRMGTLINPQEEFLQIEQIKLKFD